MIESLLDAARQPFLDLAADVHGSLVYLDPGAAEVAELTLGPAFLLGLGALNVCLLEQASADDGLLPLLSLGGHAVQSLVVFTTQLLPESHQQMLNLLMVHPHVQRCQIFCSVSELAHAQLSADFCDLGVEAYREYVSELRQHLAGSRAQAGLPMPHEDLLQLSVRHVPLHIAALDTATFVLPAASAPATKAVLSGRAAGLSAAEGLTEEDGDEGALGASAGLSLLSHALADLSRVLGAKLEPFAIGPASTAIAKELATLPQAGQRSGVGPLQDSGTDSPRADIGTGGSGGSIGLVLVDRSLDLATPCMHSEHVLDLVFSCLQGQVAAPVAQAPAGVRLRPVDVRLDVSRLAPLCPLPPAPPVTPPLQQSSSTAPGASSSSSPVPPSPSAEAPPAASGMEPASTSTAAGVAGRADAHSPEASTSRFNSSYCLELWPGGRMGLSLFHPEDRRWLGWLKQLWPKPHKDVLLLLRKWLKEALRTEKITPGRSKLTAAVQAPELRSLAGYLMSQPDVFMRHQPIIGLALAAAAAIDTEGPASRSPAAAQWQTLADFERQLLLTLPDGAQGREMLLAMLLQAVQAAHPDQHRLQLSGVLELLLTTYSLSGDRTPPATPLYSGDEAQIREALADVILAHATAAATAAGAAADHAQPQVEQALGTLHEQLQSLPHMQQLVMEAVQSRRVAEEPNSVRDALNSQLLEVWLRLRWLASARGKLRDVRRLMEVEADTGAASSTRPLLRQVLGKILLQAENRDLKQVESSSLVGGLLAKGLTKGLGRLGFGAITAPVRRVRIDDYSTVLLFVVGGISPAEIRHLQTELEQHVYGHKPRVLIGGTTLLSPGEASRLFFS